MQRGVNQFYATGLGQLLLSSGRLGDKNKIGITVKDILIGFNGSPVFKVVFRADIIRKARKRIKAEAYNGKPAVAPSSRSQF